MGVHPILRLFDLLCGWLHVKKCKRSPTQAPNKERLFYPYGWKPRVLRGGSDKMHYDTTASSQYKIVVFLASSKAKVDERRNKPANKPV